MLKILKIKVNGFKMLKDDFEINLTTRARVYNKDLTKEIIKIDDGLYTFTSLAFVGGNSSGKSTILTLILKTYIFIQTGRWEYVAREFNKDKISICILFYLDKNIYSYSCDFLRLDPKTISLENKYSPIINEKLYVAKYDRTKGLKNIEQFDLNKKEKKELLQSSLNDTSAIVKLSKDNLLVDHFYTNNLTSFDDRIVRNKFFNVLNTCSIELSTAIIKLLDDSIEYIICDNSNYVRFKRFNKKEIIISGFELMCILSSGTLRGIELYIRGINALKDGKPFIVDEIESCFQKNLVYNLLFLFNDSSINKKGAQLVFSTQYVEILDYLSRRDGIFITHKYNGKIDAKNLYSDFEVRTELLKSKQFDNNVFDTALNYKQLIEVRRNVLNELQTNND